MSDREREIYYSENGDRWFLCRDDDGGVFVLHRANVSSGGTPSKIELGEFLGRGKYLIRFLGFVVSAFAALGDVLRPKTFAGLFGAAPSVALATLSLAVWKEGNAYAAMGRTAKDRSVRPRLLQPYSRSAAAARDGLR